MCSSDNGCIYWINHGTYKGSNTGDNIGAYWWNYDGTISVTNTWSISELNTVNLNKNFLNNIGTTWARKIATNIWKVGGNTHSDIVYETAANAYKNEYVNPAENTTHSAKIGLMYISDYGFAASPSTWGALIMYNSYINNNWMYMGLSEWTIVRRSDYSGHCFLISNNAGVGSISVGATAYALRPVFYLNSDVTKVGITRELNQIQLELIDSGVTSS